MSEIISEITRKIEIKINKLRPNKIFYKTVFYKSSLAEPLKIK